MKHVSCVVLAALLACGGDESPAEPVPAGPGVLTPAGGTLSFQDGAVTLVAPAGAVSRNVALEVAAATGGGADDPSLVRGAIFEIRSMTPIALRLPVRVTLRYDPARGPAGVPETHYGMAVIAAAAVSHATTDSLANTVSADLTEFGTIGVGRIPPAQPCTAAEHRQFDFWIGAWRVGTVESDITSEPSGCAIFEHYRVAPVAGRSISVYDGRTNRWYQTYSFGSGDPLIMSGGIEDGRMVMRVFAADGQVIQRWTWQRHADGTVTQRSESTTDNGLTWQQNFNGTYQRR